MNKDQLPKLLGDVVRLQPRAVDVSGAPSDDEWAIDAATKERLELRNLRTRHIAVLASDGVYSYFADAKRTTGDRRFGFLQLHMQVTTLNDGTTDVRPLAPPRAAVVSQGPILDGTLLPTRRTWLELEERFSRIDGEVVAIWQEYEDGGPATWSVYPGDGGHDREWRVQQFGNEARTAGSVAKQLRDVALRFTTAPGADPVDYWLTMVATVVNRAPSMTGSGQGEGRRFTSGVIERAVNASKIACAHFGSRSL